MEWNSRFLNLKKEWRVVIEARKREFIKFCEAEKYKTVEVAKLPILEECKMFWNGKNCGFNQSILDTKRCAKKQDAKISHLQS